MLKITKNMEEKFEKIQNIIFSLIPEKWDNIYLYASVITSEANFLSGEMFFYYIPKGFLKKKPINVYEVPSKFNINEEQYLNVVKELYDCIKDLKQDFYDTDQDLWTNITISINNIKLKVEFNYEKLPLDEKENKIHHMIWRYKYLGIGGEKKEDKKILEEYFSRKISRKNEVFEMGFDMKNETNRVGFDREAEENSVQEYSIDKNDNGKKVEAKEEINGEKKPKRNQILNW